MSYIRLSAGEKFSTKSFWNIEFQIDGASAKNQYSVERKLGTGSYGGTKRPISGVRYFGDELTSTAYGSGGVGEAKYYPSITYRITCLNTKASYEQTITWEKSAPDVRFMNTFSVKNNNKYGIGIDGKNLPLHREVSPNYILADDIDSVIQNAKLEYQVNNDGSWKTLASGASNTMIGKYLKVDDPSYKTIKFKLSATNSVGLSASAESESINITPNEAPILELGNPDGVFTWSNDSVSVPFSCGDKNLNMNDPVIMFNGKDGLPPSFHREEPDRLDSYSFYPTQDEYKEIVNGQYSGNIKVSDTDGLFTEKQFTVNKKVTKLILYMMLKYDNAGLKVPKAINFEWGVPEGFFDNHDLTVKGVFELLSPNDTLEDWYHYDTYEHSKARLLYDSKTQTDNTKNLRNQGWTILPVGKVLIQIEITRKEGSGGFEDVTSDNHWLNGIKYRIDTEGMYD